MEDKDAKRNREELKKTSRAHRQHKLYQKLHLFNAIPLLAGLQKSAPGSAEFF